VHLPLWCSSPCFLVVFLSFSFSKPFHLQGYSTTSVYNTRPTLDGLDPRGLLSLVLLSWAQGFPQGGLLSLVFQTPTCHALDFSWPSSTHNYFPSLSGLPSPFSIQSSFFIFSFFSCFFLLFSLCFFPILLDPSILQTLHPFLPLRICFFPPLVVR